MRLRIGDMVSGKTWFGVECRGPIEKTRIIDGHRQYLVAQVWFTRNELVKQ